MNNDDVNREIQRKARARQNEQAQRGWEEQDVRNAKTKAEYEARSARWASMHKTTASSFTDRLSPVRPAQPGGGSGSGGGLVAGVICLLGLVVVMGGGLSGNSSNGTAEPPSADPSAQVKPKPQQATKITQARVAPAEMSPASPAGSLPVVMDAFALMRTAVAPGDTLEVSTQWHRADGGMRPVDFAYRLDSLSDPDFPPVEWRVQKAPGLGTVGLALPANLPAGRYTIAASWGRPGYDGDERAAALVVRQ